MIDQQRDNGITKGRMFASSPWPTWYKTRAGIPQSTMWISPKFSSPFGGSFQSHSSSTGLNKGDDRRVQFMWMWFWDPSWVLLALLRPSDTKALKNIPWLGKVQFVWRWSPWLQTAVCSVLTEVALLNKDSGCFCDSPGLPNHLPGFAFQSLPPSEAEEIRECWRSVNAGGSVWAKMRRSSYGIYIH